MKSNVIPDIQQDSDLILKRIIEFRTNYVNFYVNITGGNPFLHSKFENIIYELDKNNINIRVLGNPIVSDKDKNIAKNIARYIDYYQISIDGDIGNMLNRSSFDIERRWATIELLHDLGVKTCVMLTLTDNNTDEIIPVLGDCIKRGVSMFAFSRVVRNGGMKSVCNNANSILRYKDILNNVFEYLVENNVDIFSFKDSLWTLFLYEKGLLSMGSDNEILGCGVGFYTMAIMPNGIVQPCSRLPLNVGNVENKSLLEIWNTSTILSQFRDLGNYEKCSECELLLACRGCRAISYAECNSLFAKDPYCWIY